MRSSWSRALPAALLVGASVAAPASTTTPQVPDSLVSSEQQLWIVQASVHGANAGSVDMLRDGESWSILLADIERLLEIEWTATDGAPSTVHTPLGEITASRDALRAFQGGTYVAQSFLVEQLRVKAEFDERELLLALTPLWTTRRGQASTATAGVVVPDARAPRASFSGVRAQARRNVFGDRKIDSGDVEVAGRLAGGMWNLWVEDTSTSDYHVREYQWYRQFGRSRVLVGKQANRLHPLLSSFELAGIQASWSDALAAPQTRQPASQLLDPRRARPASNVRRFCISRQRRRAVRRRAAHRHSTGRFQPALRVPRRAVADTHIDNRRGSYL